MAIKKFRDEQGSVSVLTLGLFILTVAMLILTTDIASIAVSKQSLVHASEAAAIRAVHNVDLALYYRGNSGVSVPIDCKSAYAAVIEELNGWAQGDGRIRRTELRDLSLTDFVCAGDRVRISTSANVSLPFRLPQSSLSRLEIHATVEAQSQRSG